MQTAVSNAHRQIGSLCGRHPLQLVEASEPLQHNAAANLGLDLATGEWVTFLDNDDWLAPNHYSTWMDTLCQSEDCKASYCGVAVCDASRQPMDMQPFNDGYSAVRLNLENYIPIHAIVFARSLVGGLVRFDENLEVYEDWDFLLRHWRRPSTAIHVSPIEDKRRKT